MRIPTFLSMLLAALVLAPPAQAVGEPPPRTGSIAVSVRADDGVVEVDTGSCSTPIRFSVRPGVLPNGGSYDVVARLRDRAGTSFGADKSWIDGDETYRGSITPRCGEGLVSGRYTISVDVVINDDAVSPVERRTGSTTVRLSVTRPALTRLVVSKTPYGSAGWQWTGRLTSNGRPLAGRRIELWWDLARWENYGVTKTTNASGTARWVSNPDGAMGGIHFRLRFRGATGLSASQSAIFDLAPR
ncbi:hypothetical protein ASG76_11520 [Nocardioides sp. Soil774]|uniref:hypothetical protein n=1 Tax=Nocardioides sp. Soil774 TaxID=1736408 RepID=UPI0006FC7EC5|nr:hypothetical protein [Nocardioides sp. Soil774]KRE94029.1 hypothetical protein ASG76_11520 [Nocardioides sp. Soil774]